MKKNQKLFLATLLIPTVILPGCNNSNFAMGNESYTITWKNFDGTVLEIDENVLRNEIPTYDGATPKRLEDDYYFYSFSGWDFSVGPAISDKTYTAVYSKTNKVFTVVWKNYDGTILDTNSVKSGDTAIYRGKEPKKESDEQYSYTFSGWDKNPGKIMSDEIFVAQFASKLEKAKVTFDLNGGTSSSEVLDKYVSKITKDIFTYNIHKNDGAFRGWEYKGELIVDEFGNLIHNVNIEKNMLFKAVFSNEITLKTVSNETYGVNLTGAGVYNVNSTANLNAVIDKGYEFVGWYIDETCLSTDLNFAYQLNNSDVEITAKVNKKSFILNAKTNQPDLGLVLIDGEGKFSNNQSKNVLFNEEITVKAYSLNATKHRFLGWYYDNGELASGDIEYTFNMTNENNALIACWNGDSYALTFSGSHIDHASISGKGNYMYGSSVSFSIDVNDGFVLNSMKINGETYSTNEHTFIMPNKPVDVAVDIEPIKYNISYDFVGGNSTGEVVENYTTLDEIILNIPVRNGYDFIGWKNDKNEIINKIELGSLGDINLTAVWDYHDYSISLSYEDDKGSVSYTGLVNYGNDILITATPFSYYEFESFEIVGKNISSNTNPWSFKYDFYEDITIKVNWYTPTHNIYYDLDGGTIEEGSNPDTFTFDDEVILNNPVKPGYIFKGWFDEYGDKIEKIDFLTDRDFHLTANWEIITYSIGITENPLCTITYEGTPQIGNEIKFNLSIKPGYSLNYLYIDGIKYNTNLLELTYVYNVTHDIVVSATIFSNSYIISYIDSYTMPSGFPAYYHTDEKVILPKPTRSGYNFVGWEDQYGNLITEFEPDTYHENLILTGKWEAVKFQINFTCDEKYGSCSGSGSYIKGANIIPSYSENKGYYFKGTVKDVDTGAVLSFRNIIVSKNATYELLFGTEVFDITYELGDIFANVPAEAKRTYTVEDEYILPTPVWHGHTFVRWEDKYGNPVTQIEKGTTGNLYFEAIWQ